MEKGRGEGGDGQGWNWALEFGVNRVGAANREIISLPASFSLKPTRRMSKVPAARKDAESELLAKGNRKPPPLR